MRITHTTVEVLDCGGKLLIHDLQIGGEPHVLEVNNVGDRLYLAFGPPGSYGSERHPGDFTLQIRDGGLFVTRHVYRPTHDHDDSESLNWRRPPDPSQPAVWFGRWPGHRDPEVELAGIPFGAITVGY